MRKAIFIVILSLLTTIAFSEVAPSSDQEQSEYLNHVSQLETSRQVLESNQFRECREQAQSITDRDARNESIRGCFSRILDTTDDQQINQITESLGLEGFNIEATQSAVSMRQYLKERLDQALYGTKNTDITNAKNIRHVGHEVYYELYEAQLGKNVLLEVSTYCLENLRVRASNGQLEPIRPNCTPSSGRAENCNSNFSTNTWWVNDVVETEVEVGSSATNNSQAINDNMRHEFERGPIYLKEKYNLCTKAVSKMCLRYECLNTITTPGNLECKDLMGDNWAPTAQSTTTTIQLDDSRNRNGQKACALRAKLRDYRRALVTVQETREKLNQVSQQQGGSFQFEMGHKQGTYQGGQGANEKSIQEITTVSSQELLNEVDSIKNAESRGDEILQNCTGNNLTEECRSHIAATQEDLDDIEVEFEAGTALEIKRIRELERDDLEAYLRENGLERYIDDIDTLTPEVLSTMISDKYRAERMAVLNRLKGELDQSRTIQNPTDQQDPNASQNDIQNAVITAAEEIKDTNARIGNILHYNNIITSFLEIENTQTGERTNNSASLQVERQGYDEFAEESERDQASTYFSGLEASDGNDVDSSGSAMISISDIDNMILGAENNGQSQTSP